MPTTRKILALVLAGGNGTRLHPLTVDHSKPALPFSRGFRIIDFVLSNLVNSKITTIYVMVQYKPQSLVEHLRKVWEPICIRRKGSIKVALPDTSGDCAGGTFKGTADAVYQNLKLIDEHKPDLVAVFASDHVYRMDVRQMAEFHEKVGAEVTIAAIPVSLQRAQSFGVLVTGPDGELQNFEEKPESPRPIPGRPDQAYASMGNYLFEPAVLVELLKEANARGETDFGMHLLPRLVNKKRAYAYNFASNKVAGVRHYEEQSYWRDIGTLEALNTAQQDVQGPLPHFSLSNRQWPILGGLGAVVSNLGRPAVQQGVKIRAVNPQLPGNDNQQAPQVSLGASQSSGQGAG